MRVFYSGELNISAGPANVNKLLRKELNRLDKSEIGNKKISYIKSKNIVLKQLEVIWKTLTSQVIVYSGTLHVNIISTKIAKLLHKKNIYIMHGCVEFESQYNGEPNPKGLQIEQEQMECADIICGVSKVFMNWIKENYPQYSQKTYYLTNGIDWDILDEYKKLVQREKKEQIVVMGGDRKTKMNLQVCQAVQEYNNEHHADIKVLIFGKNDPNNEYNRCIRNIPCAKIMGNQSHDIVLRELSVSKLYVQNSIFEPFGLAVIEALMCGCNLVISSNVGAKSIFDIDNQFIINDCSSVTLVKNAIEHGLDENNNVQILQSIDKYKSSGMASAKKLLYLIDRLYKEEEVFF